MYLKALVSQVQAHASKCSSEWIIDVSNDAVVQFTAAVRYRHDEEKLGWVWRRKNWEQLHRDFRVAIVLATTPTFFSSHHFTKAGE